MHKAVGISIMVFCIVLAGAAILVWLIWASKINPPPIIHEEKYYEKNLDDVITRYIEEKVAQRIFNGKVFEAHELLETEEKEGKIYAYLWSRFTEYILLENKLKTGSGGALPLVLVLTKDETGKYTVIEHKLPKDGKYYAPSIREMFPKKYHDYIISYTPRPDLDAIITRRTERYFGTDAEKSMQK